MLPGISPQIGGLVAGALEVTATSGGPYNISDFFSAGDWSGPLAKKFIIPSGVFVGGYLDETAGRGGPLEIVVNGTIMGYKGVPNSGAGGTALFLRKTGITLSGSGTIAGGGGAGGQGGTGGHGVYTAQDGPFYSSSAPQYYWYTYHLDSVNGNPAIDYSRIYWNGTSFGGGANTLTSWYDGSVYTYYRYTFVTSSVSGSHNETYMYYQVYRTHPVVTNGGAGGAGGYGDGANGSKTSGSAGAAGGTNAGAGGTGGAGSAVGVAGLTGSTGASGNNGAGTAGSAGGAAGKAIEGYSFVTSNLFTGTYNGGLV